MFGSEKMRIIYYIHSLQIGGAETVVTEYLLQLLKEQVQVELVVNRKINSSLEEKLDDAGIPVISLLPENKSRLPLPIKYRVESIKLNILAKKRWKEIIEEFSPDLIHVHTMGTLLDCIDFPADRIVYSFHTDVSRTLHIGGRRANKNLEQLANDGMYFFAINHAVQNDVRERYDTDRVFYTPNGLRLAEILAQRASKEDFLNELKLPQDTLIVGHVGRIHPVKNHDKLLGVFSEIKSKNSNSILLVIGSGSDEEVKRLHEKVVELGLDSCVIFMGNRTDAQSLMSIMDVFVFPSIIEGFPLVLLEAQVFHTRCIVSDTIPDDVICNDNCIPLSLDWSDSEWADTALSEAVVNNGKSIESFDLGKCMKKYISYYQKVIENANE